MDTTDGDNKKKSESTSKNDGVMETVEERKAKVEKGRSLSHLKISNIDSPSHPLFEQAVAVLAAAFCGTTKTIPEQTSAWCITGQVRLCPWTETPSQEHQDIQKHWARLGFIYGVDTGGCFCVQDEAEEGAPVVAAVVCDPPPKYKELHSPDPEPKSELSPPAILKRDQSINARLGHFAKLVMDFHSKNVQDKPHWNVQMLGVSPTNQGKRYSSNLLKHLHALAETFGVDLYLETVGDKNKAVFERAGYHVMDSMVMSHATAKDEVTMLLMKSCTGEDMQHKRLGKTLN